MQRYDSGRNCYASSLWGDMYLTQRKYTNSICQPPLNTCGRKVVYRRSIASAIEMKQKNTEKKADKINDDGLEDEIDDSDEEEESDEGSDETEAAQVHSTDGEPAAKIARINKKELYKPPTNEELNQLRETENLFQSTLFRMQIDELLNEVRLKDKRRKELDKSVKLHSQILKDLPRGKEHELHKQKWLTQKGIQIPIRQSPRIVKSQFQFLPPTEVQVIGSYPMDICIKPDITVDLAVIIPKECFQTKDYLNHRYLRKRAVYLSVLAFHLRKCQHVEEVKFMYHHGNPLKPILFVQLKDNQDKAATIHIHAVPEGGSFKLNRFHVNKNNVRQHWYEGKEVESDDTENQPATPFYNTAILQDLTTANQTECLQKALEGTPGVLDGIALLKVWLRQRELNVGHGGFSSLILSMFIVYLLSRKKLSKMMSSYQIMRNTLINLAHSDWTKDGITLCGDTSDPHQPILSDFHRHFDVVFVDITGYVNLCADMNSGTFYRVQHEAKLAVQFLENHGMDSFTKLFMTPVTFLRKFDHVFHITNLEALKLTADKFDLQNKVMDHGGDYVHAAVPSLLSVLSQGLSKRVHLIQIKQDKVVKWNISDQPPEYDTTETITVGLLLNPDFASSVLDKGPIADTAEAKDFREFWGEKSELRRFKDGAICEAVAWMEKGTISRKRMVCAQVVKHILSRHCGIERKNVKYIGDQLDSLLWQQVKLVDNCAYGTGEEQHQDIIQSYDDLCKMLRNVKDLPLTINSIQGTSPVFRYAEVFPAVPFICHHNVEKDGNMDVNVDRFLPVHGQPCPPLTPTLEVVCLLEGSGKWPDDKQAFRRLKAAFHVKLSEVLEDQFSLPVSAFPDYVDVKKDNYVYRLYLAYLREIALQKQYVTPEGMIRYKDTEESQKLEKNIKAKPQLTSTLHGLQQQHSTFSCTVRLAKRWIAAHLLGDYIEDEAVELIVAYLYISPAPYSVPNSPITGFQRFLHLVSRFDWKTAPLMVNLNSEFTKEDLAGIPSKFTKERSAMPLMFISTPQDKLSSHWTRKSPSAPILKRLMMLAHESLQVLTQHLNQTELATTSDFKQIFRPPLDDYDVIIHLQENQLPRQHQSVDLTTHYLIPSYNKILHKNDQSCLPVYDYDPVALFLEELKAAYSDFAMFFHDKYGGTIIGVLWKPSAFKQQDFKVSKISGQTVKTETLDKAEVQMKPNIDAILEDFSIIGDGLVQKIEARAEKWKF